MVPTTTPMIAQVQQAFETLLAELSGPQTPSRAADTVELAVFRRLFAIGAGLMQVFFETRAAVRPADPVSSPDGTVLHYHDRRPTTYVSIFGKLVIRRHAYTAPGQPVVCPLDAELSLPARCYSLLLREWMAYGSTDGAYRETQTLLERILGLTLSVQALETCLAEDAVDLPTFDQQPASPVEAAPATESATILVAQADGKGVPLVLPRPADRPARPGKGQPANRMKEAVVTALYTIAPYPRTPQEVVTALLGAAADVPARAAAARAARPRPVGKQLRATLDGKPAAVAQLAARAAQRDGAHIRHRVALTDGAAALQTCVQGALPDYTLVLDVIHATEHLWEAANAHLGERHPARTAWVRSQLTQLLGGESESVIATLAQAATDPERTATQRQTLVRVAAYYRRNQPYMRYDAYLAAGWPIGTGVVEGACGHLVKDRMQQAGMRWTPAGAQAVLDLRAVRLSGEWERYWAFHRQQQHDRCYGSPAAAPIPIESRLLQRREAA